MDPLNTPADPDAFQAALALWLEAHFPPGLKGRGAPADDAVLDADQLAWRRLFGATGWGVATWPVAYGGAGLDDVHQQRIEEALALAGAYNPVISMGTMMLGPTLLEFGTELQKLRHLPPVARGDIRWCQGFSEPGAGSDLAALKTHAEDRGDHFAITGQKIWTSYADLADWCFCLVRTDTSRKQGGISFVLFDMRQPGVEVRPIRLISGDSPFCETFLSDVRAEKDDLVGPLNGGWGIAKRLLQHERAAISGNDDEAVGGVSLIELARHCIGVDETGRLGEPGLRDRIIRHEMERRLVELTTERVRSAVEAGLPLSSAVSSLKNAGAQVFQERAELSLEVQGYQGLGWEGDGFSTQELATVREWLHGKAWSIFGGSAEIQNNIIAKQVLGLPS